MRYNTINKFLPYPGEDCNQIGSCFFGGCKNGKCTSNKNPEDTCLGSFDCPVGYFCQNQSYLINKCKPQLQKGSQCTKTDNCVNNLVCLESKCSEYFSLANGKTFSLYGLDNTEEFTSLYCESGNFIKNGFEATCTDLFYLDSNNNNVITGFKECDNNMSNQCQAFYKAPNNNFQLYSNLACICGNNRDGKAYCRDLGSLENKKAFIQFINDNNTNCHTLNRERCLNRDKILYSKFNELKAKAFILPQIQDAPDCFFSTRDLAAYTYNFK